MDMAHRINIGIVVSGLIFVTGCASSPSQQRLEQNFVYNCSLNLLGRGVSPSESEKLCSSAHRAEMEEKKLQMNSQAQAGGVAPGADSKAAVEVGAGGQSGVPMNPTAGATPVATAVPSAAQAEGSSVDAKVDAKSENRKIANDKVPDKLQDKPHDKKE